ncbi:MAG: hypothetical protein KI791_07950 [Cyclobacteriaceae bacterium]|nr:hypothetical protein [Cyclobacteriaceae bacterium SS2]
MTKYNYPKGVDRKFRLPRIWSNFELKKFTHLFEGKIINVSGWKDEDKEGRKYADYFLNKSGYSISNHPGDSIKGIQDEINQIELDLEQELSSELISAFDVVFNHTVLEHVYDFHKAIENICLMSKDIIITVVPFLQQMHGFSDIGGYGDYWRFSPTSLDKLFKARGFETLYLSYNREEEASVYIFCISSKNPQKWKDHFPLSFTYKEDHRTKDGFKSFVGANALLNKSYIRQKQNWLKKITGLGEK